MMTVKEFAMNWIENADSSPVPEIDIETARQYLADVYHCSDEWGQKMTEEEMYISLVEWEKEKWPGDYSPAPYLFRECCKYWNELCDSYPN